MARRDLGRRRPGVRRVRRQREVFPRGLLDGSLGGRGRGRRGRRRHEVRAPVNHRGSHGRSVVGADLQPYRRPHLFPVTPAHATAVTPAHATAVTPAHAATVTSAHGTNCAFAITYAWVDGGTRGRFSPGRGNAISVGGGARRHVAYRGPRRCVGGGSRRVRVVGGAGELGRRGDRGRGWALSRTAGAMLVFSAAKSESQDGGDRRCSGESPTGSARTEYQATAHGFRRRVPRRGRRREIYLAGRGGG
ncbi:unnamed protein product [Ectocarpus fasciculatus]